MKSIVLAAGLFLAVSDYVSAAVVVRVPPPVVVVPPPVVVAPARKPVYIAPTYRRPAHGYVWKYHPRHGWGWYNPRYGWHRGWR